MPPLALAQLSRGLPLLDRKRASIVAPKVAVAFGPLELAVARFIIIPGVGAALIAWLVERLHPIWFRRRKATAIAGLAAAPAIVTVFIPIVALLGAGVWLLLGRVARLRGVPDWQPARIMALVVFAAVVLLGAIGLTDKVRDVL